MRPTIGHSGHAYTENAVDEFEAMGRLCAEFQIERDYEFGEELLQEIMRLTQMLRSDDPDAQIAATGYFRKYRYLLDAIWPAFRPQFDWLLSRACSGRTERTDPSSDWAVASPALILSGGPSFLRRKPF